MRPTHSEHGARHDPTPRATRDVRAYIPDLWAGGGFSAMWCASEHPAKRALAGALLGSQFRPGDGRGDAWAGLLLSDRVLRVWRLTRSARRALPRAFDTFLPTGRTNAGGRVDARRGGRSILCWSINVTLGPLGGRTWRQVWVLVHHVFRQSLAGPSTESHSRLDWKRRIVRCSYTSYAGQFFDTQQCLAL